MTSVRIADQSASTGPAPIPTEYGGVLFRSRLEARWAIVFDRLGIRWEYEAEAYQYDQMVDTNGETITWRYLPDFHLPDLGYWCEVKGDTASVTDDYLHMLGHVGHMLPGVRNSSGASGVILLGAIPDVHGMSPLDVPAHILVSHYKGASVHVVSLPHVEWYPWEVHEADEWSLSSRPASDWWAHRVRYVNAPLQVVAVQQAYAAARRHRFWNPA